MNKDLKNKILITAELASSEVGVFFQNLGFELEHVYREESNYFLVINTACPEATTVPRLQILESLSPELQSNVYGRINKEMFYSEQGRALLTSYFRDAQEFDLVDRYSKEMSKIYTIKIHEFLNVGYFIDLIIVEAYKAKFDISALRAYLNLILNFSFIKVESSSHAMPVDVSYSHNGEAFAVQINFVCDDWRGISEMESCIEELIVSTNYFDTTYFHKTDRLTLSALFFKNPELKEAKATFINEVIKRSPEIEIKKVGVSGIYSGLEFNEPVRYQGVKKFATDPAMKLFIARKFAHFIKNYRQKTESPPIPLGKLQLSDVMKYLTHYPKQKDLEEIDSEVKQFIFKLLMNSNFSNDVDDFVQQVMESSPYAVIREIHKIMGDKGLDDVESIIAGQALKVEDNFVTRVSGSSEDNSEFGFQRISGSGYSTSSDNEVWKVASLSNSDNNLNENKRWEIQHLASQEISAKEKLEKEFVEKILNEQAPADAIKEKLESQVDRLKKIMYQLKKEVIRLQSEKNASEELEKNKENLEAQKVFGMMSTMEQSFETIKNKDFVIEKMRNNFDQFVRNKDQVIESLEQKIQAIENDQLQKIEIAGHEKINKLENENKSLNFKLELANKKITVVSERMQKREIEVIAKRDKEIDNLKEGLRVAQLVIDKMKIEWGRLETPDSSHHAHLNSIREDIAIKKTLNEKEEMIQILSDDRKDLEDKLKIQNIALKKAEQKLKFTASQLDMLKKKHPSPNSNLKSPEVYVKQLDLASSRMAEVTAEVLEKRREVVKVKQENTVMQMKIADLERKITILEKKVA